MKTLIHRRPSAKFLLPRAVALTAWLLLAASAFAQSVSPWENAVSVLQQAFTSTIAAMLALAFFLMQELTFLVPYKSLLFHQYGAVVLAYAAVLFFNVFAAAFALNRRFFLKDTGRKLSHLDKQFNIGHGDLPAPSREEELN